MSERTEIVCDLPAADYHAGPEISASTLARYARMTPRHAWHEEHNGVESDSMRLGTAAHCAILEGDLESRYRVLEKPNLATKGKFETRDENKADWAAQLAQAAADGVAVVNSEEYARTMAMRDAVHAHPAASLLVSAGKPEVSMYAEHEGRALRCRHDWLPDDVSGVIVDLKTTDKRASSFAKSVIDYGYHIAAHHYRLVTQIATGEAQPRDMVWIVVERKAPFCVAVYYASTEVLDYGESQWREAMNIYQNCIDANSWPGYSDQAEELLLPPWLRH